MDPLTRGALFHSAQFELFRALNNAHQLPITADRLPDALDLADQVLDRVAAQYEDELAPAIPRVWKSEIENLRTDLRGWLQQVAATQSDWLPVHFEFGFGLAPDPHRDPASTTREAVIFDGIRLRGSIDLIERHATQRCSARHRSQNRQGSQGPPAIRGRRRHPAAIALRSRRRNITERLR